jgi:hypothetical protein
MTTVQPPQYYTLSEEQIIQINKIESAIAAVKFSKRTNKYVYKKSTGYGESEAFGFIRRRNRVPGPGRNNARYPELWKELQVLGDMIPIPYDAVQVNKNCVCNAHKDEGNEGLSLLISGGNYTGGELITSAGTFNAKYRGVLFDGSKIEHSNAPMTGNKWSIVFYTVLMPKDPKGYFAPDFRTTHPYYRNRFLDHIPERDRLYFPNGFKRNQAAAVDKIDDPDKSVVLSQTT